MKDRVTSRQVAELAGVSRGTVDRVLHNRGSVRPEVEQRVREIAEQLGYVPDRAGRALSQRKNPPVIGVLLHAEGNPFFDPVQEGIQAAIAEYSDFLPTLHQTIVKGYDVSVQLAHMDALVANGIQVLVLTPINDSAVQAKIDELVGSGIAVITLNADIEGSCRMCYIGCDYTRSGETAAGLMGLIVRQGKVGVVTGSVKMLGHNQRVHGFLSVCRKKYPELDVVDIVENEDDETRSYQVVSDLLSGHPELNALYFTAGGVVGGLRALKESGRNDIAVVTCDHTEEIRAALSDGTIAATVAQKPFRQGYEATKTAMEYLLNGKQPPEQIFMDNEVLIRENQ